MFSFDETRGGRSGPPLEKIYQFRGVLPDDPENTEGLFLDTIETIAGLPEFSAFDFPEAGFKGKSFQCKSSSGTIECVAMKYRRLWAARFDFLKDEEPNIRRRTIYDLALTHTRNGIEFGMRAYAEHLMGQPALFQSDIIKRLAERIGLYQSSGPILDGTPLKVQEESQVDEMFDLIVDSERTLPVVVVSEINSFSRCGNPNLPRYILSPGDLAKHLQGFAFVVQLSRAASREWGERAGRGFSVYDGSIRTYYPHRDFFSTSPKDHPGIFKDNIPDYQFRGQKGARAYFGFLVSVMRKRAIAEPISWKQLYFFEEARRLKSEIDLYEATYHNGQAADTPELVSDLNSELEPGRSELREKEHEISELQALLKIADEKNTELLAQIERLNHSLSFASEKTLSANRVALEVPISYETMADRCREVFSGKLMLLKRAEHSLSKAQFESPELVFRALSALAHEYRDFRLGKCKCSVFLSRCRELGVSFSDVRRDLPARLSEAYNVNYPPESQSVQSLRFQLCKGNSKKRRYRMRIYFFWSESDKLVVVGELPQQIGDK